MTAKTNGPGRRDVLRAGLGVAALPLLASGLPSTARAAAPVMGASQPTHYRFKHGAFEITTINDGAIVVPKVHPIFGNNMTEAEVASHMRDNYLPGDKMKIGFTPVIVNTGSEVVLFDAGNGPARREIGAGRLAAALGTAGFSPEQIDVVAITHFHPDHIGGLIEDGAAVFPNARYVTHQAEYDFWTRKELVDSSDKNMAGRAKLVQSNVVPLAEKMSFIKDEGEVAGGIRAIEAFGHTPGHTAYHIESGNSRLVLWADATNHYVASLQKPDWHVVFDMDKDQAVATRKKLLNMVAADKIPATGYHMPFPAVGYVEASGPGYRWLPATYQLEL